MDTPPFFIVGCGRSGTTLLRLMLTQHTDLHIPQESGFLDRLHDRQGEYGDFTWPHQRWFFIRDLQANPATSKTRSFPIFDLTIHEAEAALAAEAPTNCAGASAALFAASAHKKGKRRWADKTPRYVCYLDWLAQAFPRAQFIHLIRDGRDIAASIRRAGWLLSIRAGGRYWKKSVGAGRQAGAALPPETYCELFYEDLVLQPEETLRMLCTWLDLTYTPAMLAFHKERKTRVPEAHAELFDLVERPVDPSRAYAWKRTMSRREIADVEDVAGDLLEELGYERTGAQLPLWVRSLRASEKMVEPLARKVKSSLLRLGTR